MRAAHRLLRCSTWGSLPPPFFASQVASPPCTGVRPDLTKASLQTDSIRCSPPPPTPPALSFLPLPASIHIPSSTQTSSSSRGRLNSLPSRGLHLRSPDHPSSSTSTTSTSFIASLPVSRLALVSCTLTPPQTKLSRVPPPWHHPYASQLLSPSLWLGCNCCCCTLLTSQVAHGPSLGSDHRDASVQCQCTPPERPSEVSASSRTPCCTMPVTASSQPCQASRGRVES